MSPFSFDSYHYQLHWSINLLRFSVLFIVLSTNLVVVVVDCLPSLGNPNFALPLIKNRKPSIHPRSSDQDQTANDGIDPNRRSSSLLLFSIPIILVGLFLISLGRRWDGLASAIGFSILSSFLTWSLIINFVDWNQNLLIWAIVAGAFLIGLLLGLSIVRLVDRSRRFTLIHLLSLQSGFAIAVSILVFSNQLTIHHPIIRPIFIAGLACLFLVISIISPPSIAISIACATIGAFLVFLGIDLLVNENRGISLGIRFLFDHNPDHAKGLIEYSPPFLTRTFLALSWACMLLGTCYQYAFLDKSLVPNRISHFYRKPASLSNQSPISAHHDAEKKPFVGGSHRVSSGLTVTSIENRSPSPTGLEDPPFLPSPQPHDFESPSQSEQRYTTDSYDTGLSAIPELTEQSTSGRGGSHSGSASGRGGGTGTFTHSHRHPSNSTYNSIRRSTLSSDSQIPTTALPSLSGVADPSSIPVSPPHTVLTDTTVFPDDSISQAVRPRLGLTAYSHSEFIEEETEVMMAPGSNESNQDETRNQLDTSNDKNLEGKSGPCNSSPPAHSIAPGSTGILTRLARVFGDASTSTNHSSVQSPLQGAQNGEQVNEEQVLQFDAQRWASLSDRQSPYEHTARLRRDLHSWTSHESS